MPKLKNSILIKFQFPGERKFVRFELKLYTSVFLEFSQLDTFLNPTIGNLIILY